MGLTVPPGSGAGVLSAPLARAAERQQDAVAGAASLATDLLSGLRVVKGLGAEQEAHRRYVDASSRTVAATGRAATAEGRQAVASLAAAALPLLLVAAVGAGLARDGEITLGQLVAALGLTAFLAGPLARAVFGAGLAARVRASARRVDGLLATPVPRPGPESGLTTMTAGLTLDGVVLPDGVLDLHVAADELLAVVALDPAVPEAVLEPLRLDVLRRRVLVADADAVLLDPVLADNVVAPDGTPAAELRDEVTAEVGGPDAPVGDGGSALSGGQRQRLLLARALAADPDVLVLHEPTSALDPVTEQRTVARLRAARAGRCTLAVTSSPALLAAADRVVLLDGTGVVDGEVVALPAVR